MSDELAWSFPFRRWSRARVERLRETAAATLPGARLEIEVDAEDGSVDLRLALRRRHALLCFLPGEADSCAIAWVEVDETDGELAEEAEALGDALARALGGIRSVNPASEELVEATVAAETPFPTWPALRAHLAERYELQDDTPELVSVLWIWSDTDRTQLVQVDPVDLFDEDWVRVASTIGPRAALDAAGWEARQEAEALARLATVEDEVRWEVTLPLAGLTPALLEAVLGHVAQAADDLEAEVVGSDER